MTLGLATVGTNADYSDADDISLEEAVDVMSAVGVFQGSDGKFSPKENLTREQAAKLIAYLDLGESAAEALPALKAFDDVEASRWSAKYIAYCQDAGYIAGVGNGKFNPTGELTGYAFGKMVLCVLGYDAEIESFTGSSWTLNVAKLMEKNDIADGIDGAASATLTREQAAQYCLNALKADMVEYDNKGTSIEINGTKIATGASKADAVANTSYNGSGFGNGTLQLAEKLYKGDLKLNPTSDKSGSPANQWTYKAKEVGTYAKSEDQALTGSVKKGALYTAIGSAAMDHLKSFQYIVNGYTYSTDVTAYAVKGDTTNNASGTGNGVTTEVYTDYNAYYTNYDVKVIVTRPYLAKISSVTAATSSADRKVTVSLKTESPAAIYSATVDTTYETESFAKNDYVLVTFGFDGAKYVITDMTAAPAAVSGKVTSVKGTDNFVADGTTYKYAATAKDDIKSPQIDDALDIYCDANGFVLWTDVTAASADLENYLVIIADGYTAMQDAVVANVVTLDGRIVNNVTLAKLGGNTITGRCVTGNTGTYATIGDVYSYTVNSNREYELKSVASPYSDGATQPASYTTGATKIGTYTVNSETKFVVYKSDDKAVTVYVGGTKAPTVTTGTMAVLAKDSTAKAVFVNADSGDLTGASSNEKLIYVSGSTPVETKDSSDPVYTYDAVMDAAKATVSTKNGSGKEFTHTGVWVVEFTDGYVSKATAVNTTANADAGVSANATYGFALDSTRKVYAISQYNGGIDVDFDSGLFTIEREGETYSFNYDTDVTAFQINKDGDSVTETTLSGLVVDDDDNYKYWVVTKKDGNLWFVETVYAQKTK
jgi:hypothetical protein